MADPPHAVAEWAAAAATRLPETPLFHQPPVPSSRTPRLLWVLPPRPEGGTAKARLEAALSTANDGSGDSEADLTPVEIAQRNTGRALLASLFGPLQRQAMVVADAFSAIGEEPGGSSSGSGSEAPLLADSLGLMLSDPATTAPRLVSVAAPANNEEDASSSSSSSSSNGKLVKDDAVVPASGSMLAALMANLAEQFSKTTNSGSPGNGDHEKTWAAIEAANPSLAHAAAAAALVTSAEQLALTAWDEAAVSGGLLIAGGASASSDGSTSSDGSSSRDVAGTSIPVQPIDEAELWVQLDTCAAAAERCYAEIGRGAGGVTAFEKLQRAIRERASAATAANAAASEELCWALAGELETEAFRLVGLNSASSSPSGEGGSTSESNGDETGKDSSNLSEAAAADADTAAESPESDADVDGEDQIQAAVFDVEVAAAVAKCNRKCAAAINKLEALRDALVAPNLQAASTGSSRSSRNDGSAHKRGSAAAAAAIMAHGSAWSNLTGSTNSRVSGVHPGGLLAAYSQRAKGPAKNAVLASCLEKYLPVATSAPLTQLTEAQAALQEDLAQRLSRTEAALAHVKAALVAQNEQRGATQAQDAMTLGETVRAGEKAKQALAAEYAAVAAEVEEVREGRREFYAHRRGGYMWSNFKNPVK